MAEAAARAFSADILDVDADEGVGTNDAKPMQEGQCA